MTTTRSPQTASRRRRRTEATMPKKTQELPKSTIQLSRNPVRDDVSAMISEIQSKFSIVGREWELRNALAAKMAGRHLLFEGDVGTGKTTLADAIASYFVQNLERVDGDDRYSAAKLVGHFDPPVVIEKGYNWDTFISGPLVSAVKNGSILFLNELNRMPEGTQNVLLAVMDEKKLQLPKLGELKASDGFYIIASMNPAEFVATTPLSEALKDRFVWIRLDYQNADDETAIVKIRADVTDDRTARISTSIVRVSRDWMDLRRGSSIRGAIDIACLMKQMNSDNAQDWLDAATMALATKVEVEDGIEKRVEQIIRDIVISVLENEDFQ